MKQPLSQFLLIGAVLIGILCGCSSTDSKTVSGSLPSGTYAYHRNISSDTLYMENEAPIFFFNEQELILFTRDQAYFSPLSSCGRYQGNWRKYDLSHVEEVMDTTVLLNNAQVDISKIEVLHRYVIAENILELILADDRLWVIEWWRYEPYIYELVQSDDYELQRIYTSTTDEEFFVLVDTTFPKSIDISSSETTKEDVLSSIENSSDNHDILTVTKYDLDKRCQEYIIYEFAENQLTARTEYCFYDSPTAYQSGKSSALSRNGMWNDNLMLVMTPYAHEVELRTEYRGLPLDQLRDQLIENGYEIL